MNENHDAFDKYVMTFDMSERNIANKYSHSYRVVHQSEEICRSLNLDTNERDLASTIALLHDIARFRQWTNYKTFKDHESFDHGDEGVKILFEEGEINNYIINKDDYKIIETAISNHNKFDVDFSSLSTREALHSKIIRDADKLDIIYSFSTNIIIELEEDECEISKEVHDNFFDHKQILKTSIKNKNDRIIKFIALIYDLYFKYSIQRILDERYIQKIYDNIQNKKLYKPYIDEAIKYLKGEVKNVSK